MPVRHMGEQDIAYSTTGLECSMNARIRGLEGPFRGSNAASPGVSSSYFCTLLVLQTGGGRSRQSRSTLAAGVPSRMRSRRHFGWILGFATSDGGLKARRGSQWPILLAIDALDLPGRGHTLLRPSMCSWRSGLGRLAAVNARSTF